MRVQINRAIAILLLSIVNLCACIPSIRNSDDHNDHLNNGDERPNFLLIDYLNDGEVERRVSFNGIMAKETSIANSG